ncbi:MAG TPA: nucleotidyltransferase family protein [Vitreimonas sp.]|uniref:nucleotidyltransferase family protein n=1 Tax=Vitreimonas sp. TaxID=3069702 RepID=UPI002D265000|nr:nucleotidyltransferase family protein [Vitreimonas sp.]HYD89686.1 nucleotidyltransferase family protein [Vitreimonas sp.]
MDRERVLDQLNQLRPWLKSQGVARIALFGSHARGEARENSDIDLIVEFAAARTPDLFAFAGLKLELEQRLGAPVDLFTPSSIHPGLRTRIEADLIDA